MSHVVLEQQKMFKKYLSRIMQRKLLNVFLNYMFKSKTFNKLNTDICLQNEYIKYENLHNSRLSGGHNL